jgi:hypothetical protein
MICALFASMCLTAAHLPLTTTTDDGAIILLGETMDSAVVYKARFELREYSGSLPLRVRRSVWPEPFRIVSADEATGTVEVKTTKWGGFKLGQGAQQVIPQVVATPRHCSRAMAYFDLDAKDGEPADPPLLFDDEEICPGAVALSPQQSIILEGLDLRGKRLWAVAAPDPRWRHAEAIGANGDFELVFAGQLTVPVLYASFSAPITPALKRIAWHEIRMDGSIRKLGESNWVPVAGK